MAETLNNSGGESNNRKPFSELVKSISQDKIIDWKDLDAMRALQEEFSKEKVDNLRWMRLEIKKIITKSLEG
jgi:hypothetical protein